MDWHRLFGLVLTDFFTGSPFVVELEKDLSLKQHYEGVYACRRGSNEIRVIVVGQLPRAAHNAPLHLFSATAGKVGYGVQHYQQRSPNTSTVLQQLFQGYDREGVIMPYTMQDFQRDYAKEHYKDLTPQERHELFTGLPAAERREFVTALSTVERRELFTGLSAAEWRQLLAHLPIEDILSVLPRKEIEKFLKHKPARKR
jgi:hypothetical protein